MDRATDRQDNIHFITGLAGNVKLQKISAGWLDSAVASYMANGGKDVRTFHSFMYKAKSWRHQQRVVVRLRFSQKAPMMPEMIQVLTRLQHLPPS